jgi:hypothetical protein
VEAARARSAGLGPVWAHLSAHERPYVRALDHRLGPVQMFGGVQLGCNSRGGRSHTLAWCLRCPELSGQVPD